MSSVGSDTVAPSRWPEDWHLPEKGRAMVVSIALAAGNGAFLVAESGGGREIRADRRGIGPWETFRVFNRTDPGAVLRHGDSVVIQVFNGRFMSAPGGGGAGLNAELPWIDATTAFTLERVAGAGSVRSGDSIALRTATGRFVVAENNGGGAVNANRTRRGPWESFSVTVMGERLVRLRSRAGRFMTAEGGGDGPVTANRTAGALWETFTLVNFTRPGPAVHGGDTVALRSWSGAYIRVLDAGGADCRANQAGDDARFRVTVSGTGAIRHGQQVALQSVRSGRFLRDRAAVVDANSVTASGDAGFTLEHAERVAVDFGWIPDGSALSGRPFDPLPAPITSTRDVLTLHFFERTGEPVTTSDTLRSAISGPAPSLASWLRTMSGDTFRARNVGVFGPFFSRPVDPDVVDAATTVGHSVLLTAAEDSGVPLSRFARDGVIDGARTAILHVKAGAVGGQVHPTGVPTTRSGIRYSGLDAGVGVTPDVDSPSRAVLCHEVSHLLLDVADRYGIRLPLRGDLIANRTGIGDWEPFVVERAGGPGILRGGDAVMLRTHDGTHVAVDPSPPNVVNMQDASAGGARVFTVEGAADTPVTSGSRIGLRTTGGRYVAAELGRDGVLTANRLRKGSWETFEIVKQGSGAQISSGDRVCLRSVAGLFVSAEAGARDLRVGDPDRQRGYRWGDGPGSGQGGLFDNADANYDIVMLALYDRIRFGWVRPRYLTPDNRGCFTIRPFVDARDALILFDPKNPHDWYTVENRQSRANIDEVRSSGLVVSWVREDEGYWQWWLNASNDPEPPSIGKNLSPAVISAAAPAVAPNMLARPVVFDPASVTKRNDPGAAFTQGEVVLPLGNGDPSRFRLSFHAGASENMVLCVL